MKFLGREWFKPATNDRLNETGHETLSDKPMALPMGMKRPETLAEQVARLVRSERFLVELGKEDHETFDEADDFDVGDDFDPTSPYEQVYDPVLKRDVSPDEFFRNRDAYLEKYKKAAEEEIPMPRQKKSAATPRSAPQNAGSAAPADDAAGEDGQYTT